MQLRDKRGEPRRREAERADEQVPLFNFNRFTVPLNRTFFLFFPPLLFSPPFHPSLFLFFFIFFGYTRFNKLIRAGRPFSD